MLLNLFLLAVGLVLLFLGVRLYILLAPGRRQADQPRAMPEPRSKPAVRSGRRPVVIRPSACMVIGPSAPAVIVEPPPRAAWEDRGWEVRDEAGQACYSGSYRVADRRCGRRRRFAGTIIVRNQDVLAYIADPPAELRAHPKGPCFQLFRPPWFRVHWEHPARNVDDALLYVEQVLDEAVNRRRVR